MGPAGTHGAAGDPAEGTRILSRGTRVVVLQGFCTSNPSFSIVFFVLIETSERFFAGNNKMAIAGVTVSFRGQRR